MSAKCLSERSHLLTEGLRHHCALLRRDFFNIICQILEKGKEISIIKNRTKIIEGFNPGGKISERVSIGRITVKNFIR